MAEESSDNNGKNRKPFDILGFILNRLVPITIIGVLLSSLILCILIFKINKPFYRAYGNLIISPVIKLTLSNESEKLPGTVREFATTQERRLTSDYILSEALTQTPRSLWPTFIPEGTNTHIAARLLKEAVSVKHQRKTFLISLSLTDKRSIGIAELVNNIMAVYLEKLENEQAVQTERRLDFLQNEEERIIAEINTESKKLQALESKLHSNESKEISNMNAFAMSNSLSDYYIQSEFDSLKNKTLYDKALEDKRVISDRSLEIFAHENVVNDPYVKGIKSSSYEQVKFLRNTIDGLASTNPERIVAEERINKINKDFEILEKETWSEALEILKQKRTFELDTQIIDTQHAYQASENYRKQIQERHDALRSQLKESSSQISQASAIREVIAHLEERLINIQSRISDINLEAKAPLNINIEDKARKPGLPEQMKLIKVLAVALAIGFAIPGAIYLAIDFLNPYVLRREDVDAAIGYHSASPILHMDGEINALITNSKALKKLAVRICNEIEKHGSKKILITGTEEAVGTSTLCKGLIENLLKFHPKVLHLKLVDETEIVKQEQKNGQSQKNLITLPTNTPPTELMEKLSHWEIEYDAIIIDARPINTCQLSMYLAYKVDAGIIICRNNQTLYKDLRRAIKRIKDAKTPAMNAILNDASETKNIELVIISKIHRALHRLQQYKVTACFIKILGLGKNTGPVD